MSDVKPRDLAHNVLRRQSAGASAQTAPIRPMNSQAIQQTKHTESLHPTKFVRGAGIRKYMEDADGFCDTMVEHMGEGMSINEMCKEMGITIRDFRKLYLQYATFREAAELGMQLSHAWWLEKGRVNLENGKFNASLWMINMTNRWGWTRRLDGQILDGQVVPDALPNPTKESGWKDEAIEAEVIPNSEKDRVENIYKLAAMLQQVMPHDSRADESGEDADTETE